MTVNLEIKGMLARLLATEDIIVEHRKVETACFNVHTRCLTLPLWEKASDNIYSLLVAHEVGHSRETPNIDWSKDYNIPPSFVNICEDARVEKLMKRRYAGLAKTFYNGYKELNDQDFFSIKDDNLDTYNLADRVNLFFKIGNFLRLNFNAEEQHIVDMIAETETFDDVLVAAEELYKYCKQKQDEQTKISSINSHEENGGGSSDDSDSDTSSEEGDNDVNEDSETSETEGNSKPSLKQSPSESENNQINDADTSNAGTKGGEPIAKTMESLENSIRDLAKNSSGVENTYVELPKVDLEKVIVSNKEIHDHCNQSWQDQIEYRQYPELFDEVDKDYQKFKRSSQKEVNYLVKEFECRKAADSYARASISKTGILNTSILHTYKYNDDIFKKVTTLADGKNHGLIFILDWSGSMGEVFLDTIKQLYNLIWFCKKVSIPFEVYAFTNDWGCQYLPGTFTPISYYEAKEGLLEVDCTFSLMNIFTSKVSSKELEKQMINIYRIAKTHRNSYGTEYYVPRKMTLSGTPLNETLVTLHQIIPQFKSENKLQKVQCVILTDGEAAPLKRHVLIKPYRNPDKPYIGLNTVNPSNTFLRDRKTGNVYRLQDYEYCDFTNLLIRNLRDNFSDVNFIGMRILKSGDVSNFLRSQVSNSEEHRKIMETWKKQKSFSIKTSGYHSYFGLSSNALNASTVFSVAEDASKTQIKSAFARSLSSKKMNKKILGEFIELVA